MIAITLIPLVGFIGLAVDATRGYMVKARLGDALDAAALAGAQVVFTEDIFEEDILMYFNANFPPGYMGADVTLNPPEVDDNKEIITLSASAEIDTTFMQVFGQDYMTIASSTEVTRKTTSMDVVLSVDMSGSMDRSDGSGSTRIAAAREAANELVNILFGDDATKDLLNIGLVPWTDKVNVKLAGSGVGRRRSHPSRAASGFPAPLAGAPACRNRRPAGAAAPMPATPTTASRTTPTCFSGRDHGRRRERGRAGTRSARKATPSDDLNSCDTSGKTMVMAGPALVSEPRHHAADQLRSKTIKNAHRRSGLRAGGRHQYSRKAWLWAWRVLTPGAPFDEADPFPKGNHQRAIVLLSDGENWGYLRRGLL